MQRVKIISNSSDLDKLIERIKEAKLKTSQFFVSPEILEALENRLENENIDHYHEFPKAVDIYGKITKAGNVVELSDKPKNTAFKRVVSIILRNKEC